MEGGHKSTQNNEKESPLCYIDGHPLHPKVRVHPGECTEDNLKCGNKFVLDELLHWFFSFFWRFFSYGTGTIIIKMVGDRHQWKVARTNSKSTPSTSTITECSRVSHMNSEKSWIVNYGSSLRKKEENVDNVCFESSKPTVEHHR